jgi:hypothetical protein
MLRRGGERGDQGAAVVELDLGNRAVGISRVRRERDVGRGGKAHLVCGTR